VAIPMAMQGEQRSPAEPVPIEDAPRQSLAERLDAWMEHAVVEHQAALAAAAAYAARTGGGPAAAAQEFARLGLVEAMRAVERAARRVYGDPPAEWARYYPSPASPVLGPHATEIVLAAGSVNRSLEDSRDPITGAVSARERLVPRITLRAAFEYGSGLLHVGEEVRPAEQWTRDDLEDVLLDELHKAIGREDLP